MTEEELARLPEQQTYKFAKTMPDNPHYYTLRKTWGDATEFENACHWIRKHSYVEYFHDKPFEMFAFGDWKYWTMGYPLNETILIDRTLIEGRGVIFQNGDVILEK